MLYPSGPAADQIELTLFGPGHGECCIVHYGENRWLVVDSCIDSRTGSPAALQYLDGISVSPDNVKIIVASHWHADHIAGLCDTLSACRNAAFYASSALTSDEFIAFIAAFDQTPNFAGGKGVTEMFRIINELEASKRLPYNAVSSDKRIVALPGLYGQAGGSSEIWALSPSSGQIAKFIFEIAGHIPQVGTTKLRCTPQESNDLSVAILLMVDNVGILLGADLEETSSPITGWRPIVSSTGRPQILSSIFKVPHHGSENGHSVDVWQHLLKPLPISVLTPYAKGRKPIPTDANQQRIRKLSSHAYLSAPSQLAKSQQSGSGVNTLIRKLGMRQPTLVPDTGAIRIRNRGASAPDVWDVECDGLAFEIQ